MFNEWLPVAAGCDDYVGWGEIIGKLATQFPMVKAVNIDDFTSNVPAVFTESVCTSIRAGLSAGSVQLIPTHYYSGPPRTLFASRSVRRSLLMPQVNLGSVYRCGKST